MLLKLQKFCKFFLNVYLSIVVYLRSSYLTSTQIIVIGVYKKFFSLTNINNKENNKKNNNEVVRYFC